MRRDRQVLIILAFAAIITGSTMLSFSYEPLDVVSERLNLAQESLFQSLFPDYTVPGLPQWLGGIIAGAIGMLTVLIITLLLMRVGKHGGSKEAQ
ncbi:MAG: PDGLE domain-containing protein [Fervidicoccaceae archaeon]